MNKLHKKNRRLCETLKILNRCKTGPDVSVFEKEKSVKVKTKPKKNQQNTFSMIKFYQSIPSNSVVIPLTL